MKKKKVKKSSIKEIMEKAEELSFSEGISAMEDLSAPEEERDCICEGDMDDKDVISRVRLF